jgi:hypothetical protein
MEEQRREKRRKERNRQGRRPERNCMNAKFHCSEN